jgi:hypothetical protein
VGRWSSVGDGGAIVGAYCATSACTNAETGTAAVGFVLSKGVLSTITIPGATWVTIYGISNAGVLYGTYWDSAIVTHGIIGIPQ